MPILLQIDSEKAKNEKEFKRACKLIHILMEKAVVDGFFKKNWSKEAMKEMERIGPLDIEEIADEEDEGTIKIGIVFAEA